MLKYGINSTLNLPKVLCVVSSEKDAQSAPFIWDHLAPSGPAPLLPMHVVMQAPFWEDSYPHFSFLICFFSDPISGTLNLSMAF